jgi:RimJ/RimL family protein N-acetyltransferase
LESERLALRRFTPQDFDLFDRLNSNPHVMRYAGGVKTREQNQAAFATRILQYYEQFPGLGVWATVTRSDGECIGVHLLNNIQGESHIQVGYLLFPEYWRRGFATEMCVRLLHYGFGERELPRICAITNLPNVESQRVLLKSGLVRDGERSFPHPAYADSGPLAWFERDRESWLAEHPAG